MVSKQAKFNMTYIGSVEICNYLEISRVGLHHGRKRGKLPPPIRIPGTNTFLWEREEVTPMMEEWKNGRKGKLKDA